MILRWSYRGGRDKWEDKSAFKALVGKPEGRRPLERPRCTWENNIRMDLREIGCKVWARLNWLRIFASGVLL